MELSKEAARDPAQREALEQRLLDIGNNAGPEQQQRLGSTTRCKIYSN